MYTVTNTLQTRQDTSRRADKEHIYVMRAFTMSVLQVWAHFLCFALTIKWYQLNVTRC